MNKVKPVIFCWIFLVLASTFSPASAQEKRALIPDDYGQFEILGSASISSDGLWMAYGIRRVNEENELRLRSLDRDTLRTVPWASRPQFSSNGRWLAWNQGISLDEKKKLEKQKKPVRSGAGVLDLVTGEERSFEAVASFSFDATGRFLALHGYKPDEPKSKGADVRVLDLEAKTETAFGSVAEFSWTDEGSVLAFIIATGSDEGNGVQIYDAKTGRVRGLVASSSSFQKLSWREKSFDLAVLRSLQAASEEGTGYTAIAWQDLRAPDPMQIELDPSIAGASDTFEIVEHSELDWSNDGSMLSIGLRPVEPDDDEVSESEESDSTSTDKSAADEIDDEDLPGFELWHTSDVRIVPMQKARKASDERRTLLTIWHLDENRTVSVGTDLQANSSIVEGWNYGLERLDAPYPWGAMFGRRYYDIWKVSLATGERDLLLEKVRYSWSSAAGNWQLTFDGTDFWTIELASGTRNNITANLSSVFADTTYDTPTDVLPPHGVGGWMEGDEAVFLYDQHDVWKVRPDGSGAEKLTSGARDDIEYRIARLPDDDTPGISPGDPIFLKMVGLLSKKEGYARLTGSNATERLVYSDKRIRGLQKADSTDVYIYRAESFDDSPDFFAAGPELSDARQITMTNPFMADFSWSNSELIDFVSETGRPLQAALRYPVGYKKGDRVPMIVYTYEIVSTMLHSFEVPSERDYYNFTAWTHNGYAVLLPDIVYTAREPGMSALESVRAAVAKVVDMGIADSAHIGLIGHSWGGYQATFLPTRTNIFAASIAGAPLTDFVSFMGQIHWAAGMPELSHWETGQARMEVPFWEDPEAHRRNSPVHKVQDLETPMLMVFGDNDGTVDFDQGTEFYNFARRAGKEMVLLVYEGERHGFRQKPNQIDYHRRILEWFAHYLKGEPAQKWITTGIPVAEQKEEGRRVAEKGMSDIRK